MLKKHKEGKISGEKIKNFIDDFNKKNGSTYIVPRTHCKKKYATSNNIKNNQQFITLCKKKR